MAETRLDQHGSSDNDPGSTGPSIRSCRSSTAHSTGPRVRKARPPAPPLKVDLSACKYELLRLVAARLGWQIVLEGSSDWDLCWTDTSISQERLMNLKPTQRINHFHGMLEICRKRSMAKHLSALAAALPPDLAYNFFPQTWQLPSQLSAFLAAAKAAGKKHAFIVKPDAGCQGKGIKLVQGGSEASVLTNLGDIATLQAVAQQYITRPFLINGLKFDLRVYVLVTDVDPLRVFIFEEGLVRFCTTPYKTPTSKNLDCAYMHLTNYAVNKTNTNTFVAPASSTKEVPTAGAIDHTKDESASKWTFLQLRQFMESSGHNWPTLWDNIGQLVVRSLLSVAPHLATTYRAAVVNGALATTGVRSDNSAAANLGNDRRRCSVSAAALAAGSCRCFEVLGYDVLLDADIRPWLIEVNHSPSFNIDSPLDKTVKEQLILDAVHLVRLDPSSINAAKKATKRASQARLLAPPTVHASSNNLARLAVHLDSSPHDNRPGQRMHRDGQHAAKLTQARDMWQSKHLGGFQQLYPVPVHRLHLGSHNTDGRQDPVNTNHVQSVEVQHLQEHYDKLLRVSQQLYIGQVQQQTRSQSLVKSPMK